MYKHAYLGVLFFITLLSSFKSNCQSLVDSETHILQKNLLEAQINNQNAQAEYYTIQNENFSSPNKKSFWRSINDNPGSILGIFGVLVASLVAFLSFYFNYKFNTTNQRENRFLDALKGLGDKDSPITRSNSAGLLQQMTTRVEYVDIISNRLYSSFMIEEDNQVINSISEAMMDVIVQKL